MYIVTEVKHRLKGWNEVVLTKVLKEFRQLQFAQNIHEEFPATC